MMMHYHTGWTVSHYWEGIAAKRRTCPRKCRSSSCRRGGRCRGWWRGCAGPPGGCRRPGHGRADSARRTRRLSAQRGRGAQRIICSISAVRFSVSQLWWKLSQLWQKLNPMWGKNSQLYGLYCKSIVVKMKAIVVNIKCHLWWTVWCTFKISGHFLNLVDCEKGSVCTL